jgi:hypothetical protein
MSDFPGLALTPLHISSSSLYVGGTAYRSVANAGSSYGSTAWPTANTGYFMPMVIPWQYKLVRFFWGNGSAASNMDVGIYTRGGVRLASTGAVAQTPASDLQYAAPAGGIVLLDPGEYFLAISNSGTTNRGYATAGMTATEARLQGAYQMASAHALPATATFADWSSSFWPLCGITRTASGF